MLPWVHKVKLNSYWLSSNTWEAPEKAQQAGQQAKRDGQCSKEVSTDGGVFLGKETLQKTEIQGGDVSVNSEEVDCN